MGDNLILKKGKILFMTPKN